MAGHLAAYAQHGAIASNHQAQIALRANLGHVQCGVLVQAGVRGSFLVQHHIAALPGQELGHVVQSAARALQRPAMGSGVVLAKECNVTKLGGHSQITSLK
jgi:hypothetical protein